MWFPFGVWIESENAWFQATFFYESLWNLIGLGILILTYYKTHHTGTTTGAYLMWYGLGRTWIEGLRTDSLYIGPFRVSQLLAALSCLAATTVLVILAFRKHDKQKLFVNVRAAADAAAEAAAEAEKTTPEETE